MEHFIFDEEVFTYGSGSSDEDEVETSDGLMPSEVPRITGTH